MVAKMFCMFCHIEFFYIMVPLCILSEALTPKKCSEWVAALKIIPVLVIVSEFIVMFSLLLK